MKRNGFRASISGGKKAIAISLAVALVLAAISVVGAFAAPSPKSGAARVFGNQLRELDFDRAWFNSARLDGANFVRTSDPARAQQYLSQYAFALRQADAIVASHGTNTTSSNTGSSSSNNTNSTNFGSAQGDLASWLHMMHGLQEKLANIGFTANVSNSNMAGAGVPVTGGSSSSSTSAAPATPNASSSSGSSSSAATATPSAGSSSTTPTATPTTSSSSSSSSSTSSSAGIPNTGSQATLDRTALAKIWGPQFSRLEDARTWLTNFKSNPANLANSSDPAKTQQWLSQYEFALRQADAIVAGRGTATMANNNNSSSPSSNNTNFGSAQSDLAQWLHMMRDLQVKLTSGVNGTSSSSLP